MKRKIQYLALPLVALLCSGSARAEEKVLELAPEQACQNVVTKAQKILGSEALRCEPGTVSGQLLVTAKSKERVLSALLPDAGYTVLLRAESESTRKAQTGKNEPEAQNNFAQVGDMLKAPRMQLNFDGLEQRKPIVVAGLLDDDDDQPGNKKPAGGDDNQPGNGRRTPPPPTGRRRGNDAPPPATNPRSKPIPVYVPEAPDPNWWNTYTDITVWTSLPYGWDVAVPGVYVGDARGRLDTRWYLYPNTFVSSLGNSSDSFGFERNGRNQGNSFAQTLKIQQGQRVKTCYYQAHYDFDWNVNEGAWVGRFKHYDAACIIDDRWGPADQRYVTVNFDGQPLMPWEKESFTAVLNGNGIHLESNNPEMNSYDYGVQNGYNNISVQSGNKRRTPPDSDGVSVALFNNNGHMQFIVSDKYAQNYNGETLQVSVVIKKADGWFSDSTVKQTTLDISGASSATDLGYASSGYKHYIAGWSFRRVNSRISTDGWVQKGAGNRVPF